MSDRRPHLVVVDDEPDILSWLSDVLRRHYVVEATGDPRIALERVTSTDVDLLISDLEMPHLRGTELLAAVQREKPSQLVLMMTAFGSIELAVQTVRAGATDFIAKPFTEKALVRTVERALAQRMKRPDAPGGLIARSEAMKRVVDVATRAARSDAAILLTGESGVGKGTIARYI
ncbi:MAG TPA: response regulator, partial [Kofleriaceae bacterium]|nr:response regulator [Kofleriaceae bacterium]